MKMFTLAAAFKGTTSFAIDQEYNLNPQYSEKYSIVLLHLYIYRCLIYLYVKIHLCSPDFKAQNFKAHKYILINMKASSQFRLWAPSISHCQEHSTRTPPFFRWKNIHCQDNLVLLINDLGEWIYLPFPS